MELSPFNDIYDDPTVAVGGIFFFGGGPPYESTKWMEHADQTPIGAAVPK